MHVPTALRICYSWIWFHHIYLTTKFKSEISFAYWCNKIHRFWILNRADSHKKSSFPTNSHACQYFLLISLSNNSNNKNNHFLQPLLTSSEVELSQILQQKRFSVDASANNYQAVLLKEQVWILKRKNFRNTVYNK